MNEVKLKSAERLLMARIADWAGRGIPAFPSHATLANETGLSVRTVIRTLAKLKDRGLIDWTPRAGSGVMRQSNIYSIKQVTPICHNDTPICHNDTPICHSKDIYSISNNNSKPLVRQNDATIRQNDVAQPLYVVPLVKQPSNSIRENLLAQFKSQWRHYLCEQFDKPSDSLLATVDAPWAKIGTIAEAYSVINSLCKYRSFLYKNDQKPNNPKFYVQMGDWRPYVTQPMSHDIWHRQIEKIISDKVWSYVDYGPLATSPHYIGPPEYRERLSEIKIFKTHGPRINFIH